MQFKQRIADGQSGKYKGLNNGLGARINNYIFNVQRSCYTLIGGLSGSAKTTLMDYILLNAMEDAKTKNIPFNVIYYSFEVDEPTKKANWLSVMIYKKYDVIISPKKIKGLGDFRLNAEEQQMVEDVLPELEELFNRITWVFETINPTGMYKAWWRHMETRGTFIKEDYLDENNQTQQRIVSFTLNNPEEYNVVIGDHMALCKLERGFDLKRNLDKLSEYIMVCRNLFKMTFFWLQQFNQGLSSVERQKFKGVDISPQQSDFKDSTNPYTDADVVLGLLNAHKMDMETCLGYSINTPSEGYNLRDRFRMLKVVKNRLDRDNIAVGLLFIGEAGSFEELPKPSEITQAHKDRYNRLIIER